MKRFITILLVLLMMLAVVACGGNKETADSGDKSGGKVMLYSSLKEAQLSALKEAFTKKYPDIEMDYYAAGTGKVLTKIATEQQSGQIAADLIWVGDPSNYITFKEQGILEPYESPEAATIDPKFKDPDNQFVGARLIVVGFAYNTNRVDPAEVPQKWTDIFDPTYQDQIVMSDPAEAGTTMYAVAGLIQNDKYGWDYFNKLKEMGLELESGTSQTINKVGAAAYKVCIGVDYVTRTLEEQGSPIKFVYPEDLVAVSSPIALVKNAINGDNGKLLYDFILSEEGQKILAANQATPIRPGVSVGGDALDAEEIAKLAMPVDDQALVDNKQAILDQFDELFKK